MLILLAAFVALATAWNFAIPPYENLDELEHAEVIRYIAVTGRLPEHGEAEAAGFRVRQEASQPPLYHILGAVWSRILRLSTTAHDPTPVPASALACGPTGDFYSKATWFHDPQAESFPWSPPYLNIHMLRLLSTLLQTVTLLGVWTLAHRFFRAGAGPLLATAIVAFNPQFLLLAAGVNNDNAVIPLATWGLLLAYDLWDRGPERWRPWAFGLIAGLSALSKLSGLAVLGLGGLAMLTRAIQRRASIADLITNVLIMVTQVALVTAPWMIRNMALYGDPTALAPMLAEVGRRGMSPSWAESRLMLLSYWGQLPCTFYPRALYWPYFLLMAGGLVGVLIGWLRYEQKQKYLLALSGIWFIVITAAWVRWNAITHAPGGRLLFPAIGASALILTAGWFSLAGQRLSGSTAKVWSALLPIWSLVVLISGPIASLAPPPRLSDEAIVPNPVDMEFGEVIELEGYQAAIRHPTLRCILVSRAYCAPTLDITLFWRTSQALTEPIDRDLTMVLQLVSAAPGETTLRLNYNRWPGRGNLPTSVWPKNRIIRDHYLLPIPQTETLTQGWSLIAGFSDPQTEERLPVTVGDLASGDAARLTQLRVPDAQPPAPGWNNTATPVDFLPPGASDVAIVLEDALVTYTPGDGWDVELSWVSKEAVAHDYIVFVHAYGGDGGLLGTGDGPPRNGAFPTHLWAAGDRVISSHRLALGDAPAEQPDVIAVGLYLPTTGDRLTAVYRGTALTNNSVVIWESDGTP
jgi:4-amino-4-deoxy-L-arabinose transferase-like glycosyltransferase